MAWIPPTARSFSEFTLHFLNGRKFHTSVCHVCFHGHTFVSGHISWNMHSPCIQSFWFWERWIYQTTLILQIKIFNWKWFRQSASVYRTSFVSTIYTSCNTICISNCCLFSASKSNQTLPKLKHQTSPFLNHSIMSPFRWNTYGCKSYYLKARYNYSKQQHCFSCQNPI